MNESKNVKELLQNETKLLFRHIIMFFHSHATKKIYIYSNNNDADCWLRNYESAQRTTNIPFQRGALNSFPPSYPYKISKILLSIHFWYLDEHLNTKTINDKNKWTICCFQQILTKETKKRNNFSESKTH